ncbi:MAG TPA: hypothetical protein VNL69_09150 [Bacteroidota bacterium]|nr:hypothetical protein [Bacteroidota bacterium]
MRVLTIALLACMLPSSVGARTPWDVSPQDSMAAYLPRPALDAKEALQRCPADEDTSIAALLIRFDMGSEERTTDRDTLTMLCDQAEAQFFDRIRARFYEDIHAIGEQLDDAIRSCPKVRDRWGQLVYDSACVLRAEQENHRERQEVVDWYLTAVRDIWPAYVDRIRTILRTSPDSERRLVVRVAKTAALMTQTAAQFAR